MLCNICKQNRASFQKYISSIGKSVPVCSACLSKTSGAIKITQVTSGPGYYSVKQTFTNGGAPNFKNFYDNKKVSRSIVCTNCAYDLMKFEHTQKMGCSECYNVFEEQVKRIVRGQ